MAIGYYSQETFVPTDSILREQAETLRDLLSLAFLTLVSSGAAHRGPKNRLWIPCLVMLFEVITIHAEGVPVSPASGVAGGLWLAMVFASLRRDSRMATWVSTLCGSTLACMLLYAAATRP